MQDKSWSLKEKWKTFFNIILDPVIISLILITIGFIYFYSKTEVNKTILSILTIIISILTGLIGGFISKKWLDFSEEKVLSARGKSAIRSLNLLLLNVSTIEKRIKQYIQNIQRQKKEDLNLELIKTNYEEIVEKCNILEEEVISSIENWTDVIPEANFKTQIGFLTQIKQEQFSLKTELKELKKEQEEDKAKNDKEKEELEKKIKEKEEELVRKTNELLQKELELSSSGLSSVASVSSGSVIVPTMDILWAATEDHSQDYPNKSQTEDISIINKCNKCGKDFTSSNFTNLCPECEDKETYPK